MLTSRRTTATRHLHNHEMKLLVHLFSNQTAHLHPKTYKKDIKTLSRRMRCALSTTIRGTSNLCMAHNGLNHYLINDIFSWVKHEFNKGIGRFLYPIIMSGKLSSIEELQIRQLEPVLEMWHKDFRLEDSAPWGHTPIDRGSTFKYLKTSCTACLLSNIGSDPDVLFALFAGMIGRFDCDKLFRVDFPLKELRPCHFDNIKSKRVRFVRYWMRATELGSSNLSEAVDLGIKIKHIGEEVKWAKSAHSHNESLGGSTLRDESVELADPFTYDEIELKKGVETTAYYVAEDVQALRAHEHFKNGPKLGPNPRPENVDRHSPVDKLGFDLGHMNIHDSKTETETIRPASSMSRVKSIVPLRINKTTQAQAQVQTQAQGQHHRNHHHRLPPTPPPSLPSRSHFSVAPSHRISSVYPASSIASYNNPSSIPKRNRNHLYDPLATSEEVVEKYRALLANNPFEEPEDEYVLPRPNRLSMYSGFGGRVEMDLFSDADVEGREDEVLDDGQDGDGDGGDVVGAPSVVGTVWNDLYD